MASCGTFWGFLAPSGKKLSEESFWPLHLGTGGLILWHCTASGVGTSNSLSDLFGPLCQKEGANSPPGGGPQARALHLHFLREEFQVKLCAARSQCSQGASHCHHFPAGKWTYPLSRSTSHLWGGDHFKNYPRSTQNTKLYYQREMQNGSDRSTKDGTR